MQRDKAIDALKGLAVVLVVAGHAIPTAAAVFHGGPSLMKGDGFWVPVTTMADPIHSLVYAFHMPLFAFVSGVVLWPGRGRSFLQDISRRAAGLLIPYAAWFFVTYAVLRLATGASSAPPAVSDMAMGRGGLWYLYALFVCVLLLGGIARLKASRWLLPLSALAAMGTDLVVAVPNAFHLSSVLWIYPFVVLGYLLAPMREWVVRRRVTIGLAALVAFVPLYVLRHPSTVPGRSAVERLAVSMHASGMHGGAILVILVRYLCAAAAVLGLYALYSGARVPAIDAQAWLGRRSLGIYAVHGPLQLWLVVSGVRTALALFGASLALSVLTVIALERIPLTNAVLLGRMRVGALRLNWPGKIAEHRAE